MDGFHPLNMRRPPEKTSREVGERLSSVVAGVGDPGRVALKKTSPEVDALYEEARAAGATGGKLTGAGGGGFLLLFVPPDKQSSVVAALDGRLHVPFAFESAGSQIIFYEPGVDYRELFDLKTDPRELTSVYDKPEYAAARKELEGWNLK